MLHGKNKLTPRFDKCFIGKILLCQMILRTCKMFNNKKLLDIIYFSCTYFKIAFNPSLIRQPLGLFTSAVCWMHIKKYIKSPHYSTSMDLTVRKLITYFKLKMCCLSSLFLIDVFLGTEAIFRLYFSGNEYVQKKNKDCFFEWTQNPWFIDTLPRCVVWNKE